MIFRVNVGDSTIHGSYGNWMTLLWNLFPTCLLHYVHVNFLLSAEPFFDQEMDATVSPALDKVGSSRTDGKE